MFHSVSTMHFPTSYYLEKNVYCFCLVSEPRNHLFVQLHSIALGGKFHSLRNDGINEKLWLFVACVVIFCRLHWSGFLLIWLHHQLYLRQAWTGVLGGVAVGIPGTRVPRGPAPRAWWSRDISWCLHGSPTPSWQTELLTAFISFPCLLSVLSGL